MQVFALSDISTSPEAGLNHCLAASTTRTCSSRTTALSAIEEEIDTRRVFTRSLFTHRNALIPISALPPELLSQIFHLHAHQEPPWYGDSEEQKLGWIRVTHVCREWRRVALNDSSLWATIKEVSPRARWISEMLVRARKAPLAIVVLDTLRPEILLMFPPHISHTRELRLHNLYMAHSQVVREICSSEAPVLECLELGGLPLTPIPFCQLAGTTLFNERAPKLRKFSLFKISIPWSLIPRGQLTELKIILGRSIYFSDTSLPNNLNQFIDLLVNSPDLEVLALEFCLPMLSQVTHGQLIHLSHLSHLCLAESTCHIANLLKILKLPSSVTLHLSCTSENSPTHTDHVILPLISAHFHNPTPMEFKSLRVSVSCLFVGASTGISPPAITIGCPARLDSDMDGGIEFTLSFTRESESAQLGRVCSMLPISNIEFLSISDFEDSTQSMPWHELIQRCMKVTTIQAQGSGTIGLLQALALPKAGDAGGASTTAPFPKLSFLLLEDLDLRAHIPPSAPLYDVLMSALEQREMNNMALKMLTINQCVIPAKYAYNLTEHVEEFSWDGDEGFEDWDNYDYSLDDPPEEVLHGPSQAECGGFRDYYMDFYSL